VLVVTGVAVVVVILAALDLAAAFAVFDAFLALVLRVTIIVSGLRTKLCLFRKQ
jgi:hypothetical protein